MTQERNFEREMRPGHGNNCNGHCQSIEAGGFGHYVGDGCGCDCGAPPSVPIDFVALPLVLTAIFMILSIKKALRRKHCG